MSYDMLLNDALYHSYDYVYSGVHNDILEDSDGAYPFDSIFKNKIPGSQFDFYINLTAELTAVTEYLLSTELCDEAALSFVYNGNVDSVFSAIDRAIYNLNSDAEYEVYTIGDDGLCLVLFKNI